MAEVRALTVPTEEAIGPESATKPSLFPPSSFSSTRRRASSRSTEVEAGGEKLGALEALTRAETALADVRPQQAVELLQAARGPHPYVLHVRLFEQLGIALSYLDRPDDAVRAFRQMLALAPSRALPYTLSPKVTFVFERARREARDTPAPTLNVSWPRGLRTVDEVPVELEVLADPFDFVARATVHYRLRGDVAWSRSETTPLAALGGFVTVRIPPLGAAANRPQTIEMFVVATDRRGNEVLLVDGPERPRSVYLRYERHEPWFEKWWVWAAAVGVVAGGAAAAAVATAEPPARVGGRIRVIP